MAVALGVKPVTAEDYAQLDADWRYDLIEGELVPMPPPPGAEHGAVTFDLAHEVGVFVRGRRLGRCFAAETRFIIGRDPDTVLAPDMAFVAAHRLPSRLPAGALELAPDLVLEVRSPSDRPAQVADKVARWLRAGVRLVWELDPQARVVTAHRAGRAPVATTVDGVIDGEDVLPGFALPLRHLLDPSVAP